MKAIITSGNCGYFHGKFGANCAVAGVSVSVSVSEVSERIECIVEGDE